MKKTMILVLVIFGVLAGCGKRDETLYSQVCINGVSYLYFSNRYVIVEQTPEGKVKTCTN